MLQSRLAPDGSWDRSSRTWTHAHHPKTWQTSLKLEEDIAENDVPIGVVEALARRANLDG